MQDGSEYEHGGGLEPDENEKMSMWLPPRPPFVWIAIVRSRCGETVPVPLFTSN